MTVKPNRIQNFDINTDRSITKLWGHDAFIVAFLDFSGKRSRKNNLFALQVQEVRKQNPNRHFSQSLIQEKGNARIAKKHLNIIKVTSWESQREQRLHRETVTKTRN